MRMNIKKYFHWFYQFLSNYNLFVPEPNEYDDDDVDPNEQTNPQTILKHQKYSTRLYILLLIGKFYCESNTLILKS